MMIFLFAIAGLLTGSLINWAADYLPRFAIDKSLAPQNVEPRLTLAVVRPTRSKPLALAVEVLTALLFAYATLRFGLTWPSMWLALIGAVLILVAVTDLKYRLVLNVVIYPTAALVVLWQVFGAQANIAWILIGGAFGLAMFWLVAWLRPGDLGGGDVKLAMLIGMLFGFPHVLWALLIGVVAGGLAIGWLMIARHWQAKDQIPYAPFLCLGALIALLYNPFAALFPL